MRFPLAVLLVASLAGCSDGSGNVVDPDGDELEEDGPVCFDVNGGSDLPANSTECPPPTLDPVIQEVPVDFDGNLGTGFAVYNDPTGEDRRLFPVAGSTDYVFSNPGAALIAVSLEMTWSDNVANGELAFEGMAMGPNSTEIFAERSATGPLTVDMDGLDIPLDSETVFHAYVYAWDRWVNQDPVHAYATADVQFHIEGTLTFRLPD